MKILSNKFFIIGNLLLLLIAIPVTLFFVKKQQELRSKATAASKLYFDPQATNTSTQCQSTTVDLMVDPGTNLVSIVDFYLTYDPAKIEITQITPSDKFKTVSRAVNLSSGQADMSLDSVTGGDVTQAASTVSKVATITFVPKGAGNAQITIDSSKTHVFSIATADGPVENVLSSTTPAGITIGSDACTSGPPSASVSPSAAPSGTLSGASPTATPAVQNQIPVCSSLSVNPSASGSAPFSVLLTGVGSDPDTSGLITKATFTFGDGQTQDVTTGLNQKTANVQTNHTYQNAGTFTANIAFTDNQNGISPANQSCTQSVTVTGASGSAAITPTATLVEKPTATPTLVEKPTIAPTGNIAQTMGTISIVIITIVGGFILLAL